MFQQLTFCFREWYLVYLSTVKNCNMSRAISQSVIIIYFFWLIDYYTPLSHSRSALGMSPHLGFSVQHSLFFSGETLLVAAGQKPKGGKREMSALFLFHCSCDVLWTSFPKAMQSHHSFVRVSIWFKTCWRTYYPIAPLRLSNTARTKLKFRVREQCV